LAKNDPPALYKWEGLCKLDVLFIPDPGSPKFHFQLAIPSPELIVETFVNFTESLTHFGALELKRAVSPGQEA
jgi:hypothetical protein